MSVQDQRSVASPSSIPTVEAPHRLAYQPALDGVRAVAVVLVVLFHLDVGVLRGGYLGVSVFFTLSGFLITSLILLEAASAPASASRRVHIGRFYHRRIKRLLPASTVTLLAVVALAAAGVLATTPTLRGDVTAAAWNVFNWRELFSGEQYAQLFQEQSPVAHFWSLAIEEQFYLVWPVLLAVVVWRLGLDRTRLLLVVGSMFAVSALSAVIASPEVAYFATWTRAAEILAGALLGVWMSAGSTGSPPRWWRRLAVPALVLIVVACVVTPTSSGWAYSGGLPLFAVVSVALIAGLQVDGGLTRALSFAPLVALGRISYGVYLVHWPIFIVFDEQRLGTDGLSLVTVRLGVTAVVAIALYVGLERPIRTSPRPLRPLTGAALALLSIVGVTIAAASLSPSASAASSSEPAPLVIGAPSTVASDRESPSAPASPTATPDAPALDAARSVADGRRVPGTGRSNRAGGGAPLPVDADIANALAGPLTTLAELQRPLTVAVFGDSIPAWLLRDAADAYTRSDAVLLNGAREGCDGMVALPKGRDRRGKELIASADCADWRTTYPAVLAGAERTDVALLVLGQAPVVDRFVDGEWRGPCDSLDWYLDDLEARVELLRDAGTTPVLAIPARFGKGVTYIVDDDHLERIGCIRAALFRFADAAGVDAIDLDELLCPQDDCERFRTIDGVHVDPAHAPTVLDELVDQVLTRSTR